MAHGDFVDVRETIGNGQFDGIVVLDDAVPFAADVAAGLLTLLSKIGSISTGCDKLISSFTAG